VTYKILIIPVDWSSSKQIFDSTAAEINTYYLSKLPLATCPGQYKGIVADLSTNYGNLWTNGHCDATAEQAIPGCYTVRDTLNSKGGVLEKITKCGLQYTQATGESWDFVVGIADKDISHIGVSEVNDPSTDIAYSCGQNQGVAGWSAGEGTLSVIVESLDPLKAAGITTHELGHQYGFGEQYCDCTGIIDPFTGKDIGPHVCGTNHPINPLRTDRGCGGKGTSCDIGFSQKLCYGKDGNPHGGEFVYGNRDRLSSAFYTSSDILAGKRSAMSNLILSDDPTIKALAGGYTDDEWNILIQSPKLQCQ